MLQTNILFVDETNSERSILAEAYCNMNPRTPVRAFSAGFEPALKLDKHLYEILREAGINPEDYCPKPIDIFRQPYSPRIDLLIGFDPLDRPYKLPIFPNMPTVATLNVTPVAGRDFSRGRKGALRACLADIGLAIDRARARGTLPDNLAA